MSLKEGKNTYRCYVCGASGDNISLVMGYLNKDFREACRWLADEGNIILTEHQPQPSDISHHTSFDASRYERFFEHPWLNNEARSFLLDERRLDPRVIRWCRLTSWKDKQGVPWLQIPYYDREGKLIGIQNRNLIPGALPRFRFPTGSQCTIYNLPVLNLLKPGDTLFITEGCSDCWAMLSAGHKAIAIPSATLLKRKDVEQLSIVNSQLSIRFGMYPDNDAPGERLFLQLKEMLPGMVRYQLPPGNKDFSDYYVTLKN
jgi:DNA primase